MTDLKNDRIETEPGYEDCVAHPSRREVLEKLEVLATYTPPLLLSMMLSRKANADFSPPPPPTT